ncbi:hypothetical protein THER_0204 [Thermodesulfovibrio sp. N1]|nr:hypothetical protein THER_0204 [Thermodesulfovibrio sp. N1]
MSSGYRNSKKGFDSASSSVYPDISSILGFTKRILSSWAITIPSPAFSTIILYISIDLFKMSNIFLPYFG